MFQNIVCYFFTFYQVTSALPSNMFRAIYTDILFPRRLPGPGQQAGVGAAGPAAQGEDRHRGYPSKENTRVVSGCDGPRTK